MCDPNPQTQYSTASKPEGRNTIRIPPRIGRGPRTVWLSDHLKYEDYSYLDDDDDDDDEIIIDLTKYPIGPSGRPIAGSKRVAAALQHGHGSESSLRPVNLPEGTAVNTTLGSNSVKVRVDHSSIIRLFMLVCY